MIVHQQMKIPQSKIVIGGKQPVFVVAEIGKNFIQTEEEEPLERYLANAKRLIDEAKNAGADAVKFQTHTVQDEQLNIEIISPHFKGADRYRWVKRNTFPIEFWKEIKNYCDQKGILFFSTTMSRGAAQLLNEVGIQLWKVGSGDILDFVMLDHLASTKKPIILSSGMSTLEELDQAISFLKKRSAETALLHCVSRYPCPPEALALGTIPFLKKRYDIPIGFSDHSIGIDSALAAVALGATIIEKHFSLARDLWGADHKVSMTPAELKALVQGIREIEASPAKAEEYLGKESAKRALGKAAKVLQEEEAVFRPIFRKALMAGMALPAGAVIAAEHLYAMRPQVYAKGLPSEKYEEVLGRKTKIALKKYQPIQPTVLE
jgi:sialic acid synthase SpsE